MSEPIAGQRTENANTRAALGRRGEELAAQALVEAGLEVLERNWRCRYGEIDIVAADGDTVVFVEVKTRSGLGFGSPAEAVTEAKLARIRRLACLWLIGQRVSWAQVRIDVVAVLIEGAAPAVIDHLRGVS